MGDNNQDLDNLRNSLPPEVPRVRIYIEPGCDPESITLNKTEGVIVEIWQRSKTVDGWDFVTSYDTTELDTDYDLEHCMK